MNIRQRIALLVTLSFLAILIIGGYAILESRHNAAEVRSVTDSVVPTTLASADLVSLAKDVQLATMALVSAPSDDIAAQLRDRLAQQKTALTEGLQHQLEAAGNDTQRGQVRQAQESLDNYFSSIEDTAKLKLAGRQALAEANLFATVAQYQREFGQIIDALRVEKTRAKDAAIDSLKARLASTVTALLIATVMVMVLLTGMGWLLYRRVVIPIGRMQAEMSGIADSQDFTRRVPVTREDEIGRSIQAFNSMIARIEENSVLLRQKTADIQSMLQHIPQGILTIRADGCVHHEYSAWLETILDTHEIAGRRAMDLIFGGSQLGADTLAQVDAAIGACIGEDVMNFGFNQHLLVGEVTRRASDGTSRILDLTWSPITDEFDTITRLMLCVRDVTELRKLAAETAEQKQELEIIGEILGVPQEKFHEFVDASLHFIEENESLIRKHPEPEPAILNQLFRNMHTIKGNARTYGLRYLTDGVHSAEQRYHALRQPQPEVAWHPAELLAELATVRSLLERYAHINEISLGRKGPGRRGSTERYLMVDKAKIQETLQRLDAVNLSNIHELVAARNAVQKALRLLGTEAIHETLSSILDSLPSLARDLGKAAPRVDIQDGGYVIRTQASALLKNVFMHLFRNSLDHGIETPQERSAAAKAAAGTLCLRAHAEGGMLCLHLADDGRGLALDRIRAKAEEAGLIARGQVLTDEDLAQQIFHPGFSTAQALSTVSGRGVGMDAVRDFLRRDNSSIRIRFTDTASGAAFRCFETIVSVPLGFAENLGEPASHIVIDTANLASESHPPEESEPRLHAV